MGMTAEEQIEHLTAQLKQMRDQLQAPQEELRQAQARIAELEKRKTSTPSFVQASAKQPSAEANKPRKKREAQYKRARQRSTPTHIEEHRIVICPDCH
jgi:non-ribosomal peptide synthetase component F